MRPRLLPASSTRAIATVPSTPDAAPSQPPPSTIPSKPPAALTSASPASSQPFSTPKSAQSPTNSDAAAPHVASKPVKLKGSVPGGTELRGLAYLKSKPHFFAKEDDEYPPWLWTLLDEGNVGEKKVDLTGTTLTPLLFLRWLLTDQPASDDEETAAQTRPQAGTVDERYTQTCPST